MNRSGFLEGILASGFAPAAIGSGVLMPVRRLAFPSYHGVMSLRASNIGAGTLSSGYFVKIDERGYIGGFGLAEWQASQS